jgi:tetratricopeptide (TPR) repeat protein
MERIEIIKKIGLLILIFFIIFISLLRLFSPITDPDFFWHIATGRWIVENGTLPENDPFSYSTLPFKSEREKFILTSYWLSQVTYYTLYSFFGYPGIIALRFLILGLIIYFLTKRLITKGISYSLYAPLIAFSLLVLILTYPMDRPQVFSFLFFTILFYLLDELDKGKRYALYVIPSLMILWSNMHGGFILGQIVLFIYLIAEIFNRIVLKTNNGLNKNILIASFSGIFAGFINPNIYRAISETLRTSSVITEGIIEYMSTIEFFLTFGALHVVIYWFVLLLTILALIYKMKRGFDLKSLMLVAGFGYFSFTQGRYMAFFVLFALPLIGEFVSYRKWKKTLELSLLVIAIAFSTAIIFRHEFFSHAKEITSTLKGRYVSSYYPDGAVRFISALSPKERLYNYYGWGGYLIWRFYPEKKVFVDGRQLYEDVYQLSRSIENVVIEPLIGGDPYWKAILKSYNINYVLIPVYEKKGNVIPLFIELLKDNEWVPVFFTENSIVFVRRIEEHSNIIYRFSLPKRLLVDDLIGQLEMRIRKRPSQISFYIAKGDLLLFTGRIKEAEAEYKRALEVFPLNSIAREKLEMLQRLQIQK